MMRRIAALAVLVGCTPLSPFRADAGADAGAAGGAAGGATAGGSSGGAVAGGASAGGFATGGGFVFSGGAGGGAAGGTGGGSPVVDGGFTWTNIGFPSNLALRAVAVEGGLVAGVSFSGELLTLDGGALVPVPGFSFVDAMDLFVTPSGRVVVVGDRNFSFVCAANCGSAASFTSKMSTIGTEYFVGVCGLGERVFAVAVGTSLDGILLEYANDAWRRVTTSLGVGTVRNCVVAPNGDVWVAGANGVARVTGSTSTPEPIDLVGQPAARWRWVALTFDGGAVTDGLVTGSLSGYRLARRGAAGTWTSLAPRAGNDLYGVVPMGDHTFFVVGTPTSGATDRFFLFEDDQLSLVQPQPPLLESASSLWPVGSSTIYVVGEASSGRTYLYRGTR